MATEAEVRYWVVNWCTESWLQRATADGWETVEVFRGPDREERAAEALRQRENSPRRSS
jgi:hypothetical protein